jgi:amidohydrolase
MNGKEIILTAAFLGCLTGAALASQQTPDAAPINKEVSGPAWIQDIPVDKVIEWRRHIHQNPELSFKETNTSDYVADILKSFGTIEVKRLTPTGVIGILRGKTQGKTVAFRADMDALPVPEETGFPFASIVKGVSHACGHDAHTAILLGTAATLSRMQDDISGTIYFIFQPGEEQDPGGALGIVKSGALKGVDAFFALHVFPSMPPGSIAMLPKGSASTTADSFYLTIQGKGTHGSMPHLGVDPVVVGSEIVVALQTIVSRNVTPGEMTVISVGKFQAGSAPNVIPDTAELAATVRTVSETTRLLVADRVKAIVDGITKANGATYTLDYAFGTPSVQNDPALVDLAKAAAIKILGTGRVYESPSRMPGSEDFANYKIVAPECLIILGVGPGPANHHPKFTIDESALAEGVKVEVQIILDYLSQK